MGESLKEYKERLAAEAAERAAAEAAKEEVRKRLRKESDDRHEAEKKVQEAKEKARAEERRAAKEAEVKAAALRSWLAHGGLAEAFEASWPAIYKDYLEREAANAVAVENEKRSRAYFPRL